MKRLLSSMMLLIALAATTVCASPPQLVNYQGLLTDSGGSPVNATVPIVVRIYAAESGGTPTWEQTLGSVAVLNGLYSFRFGDGDLADALTSEACWMELVVDGETQTPRQPLASVPFALKAQAAETALHADTAANAQTLEGYGMAAVVNPVGVVLAYAGSTAPDGYLLCDGEAVNRSTYSALFGVIGITYGAGDGSTTFHLPDLRGRVAAGKDNMGGASGNRMTNSVAGATLGATGGLERHALSIAELPSHRHILNTFGVAPSAYGYPDANGFVVGVAGADRRGGVRGDEFTGGNQLHNNVQPTIILNYIIKY